MKCTTDGQMKNRLAARRSTTKERTMKNKPVDVNVGEETCAHAISPKAESWGGYARYWCEACFCSVVPPVPWSEVIEEREIYEMCKDVVF